MSGRRTDTRQRVMDVALELFSMQGYEKTSLREIADRLGVTKAALYYHFPTKAEILVALAEDVGTAIEEYVSWGQAQPRTPESDTEVLRRLAVLVRGRWGPMIAFLQRNQPAMRDLQVGMRLSRQIQALLGLFSRPGDSVREQVWGSLAVLAVYFGNLPAPAATVLLGIDAPDDEVAAATLDVAMQLVSERRHRDDKTPQASRGRGQ